MRRAFLAVVLSGIPALGGGTPSGIDRVGWLQGCWVLTAGGRTIEEQWTSPRGGIMLGTGRTVEGGRLVEYEFVVLRERGEALVYEAHPSGQPSAEFVSTRLDDDGVVFENPAHDFPQRVGYRRRASFLDAWIEGTSGGRTRRIDFPYERVSCPGK